MTPHLPKDLVRWTRTLAGDLVSSRGVRVRGVPCATDVSRDSRDSQDPPELLHKVTAAHPLFIRRADGTTMVHHRQLHDPGTTSDPAEEMSRRLDPRSMKGEGVKG